MFFRDFSSKNILEKSWKFWLENFSRFFKQKYSWKILKIFLKILTWKILKTFLKHLENFGFNFFQDFSRKIFLKKMKQFKFKKSSTTRSKRLTWTTRSKIFHFILERVVDEIFWNVYLIKSFGTCSWCQSFGTCSWCHFIDHVVYVIFFKCVVDAIFLEFFHVTTVVPYCHVSIFF